MAAIACDLCGEEPAALMQTDLVTGDTVSVGAFCLVTFTLGMATGLTEGIEPEVAKEYAGPLAGLLANLAPSMLDLAHTTAPRRPRKPKTAAGGQGVSADATAPAETAP